MNSMLFNKGFIAFCIGNHHIAHLSGSPWCCEAVVRHSVSRKPRTHCSHVTCIAGMPYPSSILHDNCRFLSPAVIIGEGSAAEVQKQCKKQDFSFWDEPKHQTFVS